MKHQHGKQDWQIICIIVLTSLVGIAVWALSISLIVEAIKQTM